MEMKCSAKLLMAFEMLYVPVISYGVEFAGHNTHTFLEQNLQALYRRSRTAPTCPFELGRSRLR